MMSAPNATPFRPLPGVRRGWWPNLQRVLAATEIDGIVIHPANRSTREPRHRHRFAQDAAHAERSGLWRRRVRWPLVHSEDLADLLCARAGARAAGSSYIGAAVQGIAVGEIVRAFARRFGTRDQEPEVVSTA